MQGSPCEIILKDLTTVRSDPARLQRWERTAMAVVAEAGAPAAAAAPPGVQPARS